MDRQQMIDTAERVIALQDVGDADGIMELFAPDCTFMMPVFAEPIRGHADLRTWVEEWPEAITETEWVVVDGDRLTCCWNWRGQGWPDDTPLLRGISTFVFDDEGLIRDYEDWFDPDWATRHVAVSD